MELICGRKSLSWITLAGRIFKHFNDGKILKVFDKCVLYDREELSCMFYVFIHVRAQ